MTIRPILSAMRKSSSGVLLVALQIALTLAILANALYIVNQRLREAATASGTVEAGLMYIAVADKTADVTGAVIERDVARLRAIPGVLSASYVSQVPLSQSGSNSGFQVDPDAVDSPAAAATYRADATIVQTLGLQLVSGRDLRAEDQGLLRWDDLGTQYPRVALITRSLEGVLFPGESAVGKTIHAGRGAPGVEVVGVVDALVSPWGRTSWGGDPGHSVIFPQRMAIPSLTYAVRVDPAQMDRVLGEARSVLQPQVPGRLVLSTRTMAETRAARYRSERTVIRGLGLVITLLLVMTAGGIIGLASLWVSQRRKQIGVRRALGARRRDILEDFLVEKLLSSARGVGVGAVVAD
ncbi:MAG: ABC transporter permease, partial [Arenimonas sp.]|nr:ABC transporter permease [Arenimonas sp.]